MGRRKLAAMMAVVGIGLVAGAGTTLAAGAHHPHHKGHAHKWGMRWVNQPTSATVNCSVSMTVIPPHDSATVSPPETQGRMYGPINCARGVYSESASFGQGVISAPFHTTTPGDTVSHFTEYFPAGTLNGVFDLTPQGGQFGQFGSQTWTGTLRVTSGSGVYMHAATTQKGKMKCSSPDSVHLTCTEEAALTWLTRVQKRVKLK